MATGSRPRPDGSRPKTPITASNPMNPKTAPAPKTRPAPMTLLITNDFPPRLGGIESFNRQLCRLLDDRVVVLTGDGDGGPDDRDLTGDFDFPVHRRPTKVLLPTPQTAARAAELMRRYGADRVLISAAAPLGLLAERLRAEAHRIVAVSHGHEVWWARAPGTRRTLRRIGAATDHLTWVSEFTRDAIAPALEPIDRARMRRLSPPVDPAVFAPTPPPAAAAKVVVSAGRFVAQKGFDTLLESWRLVLADHPEATLLIAGDGPQAAALMRRRNRLGLADRVRFLGPRPHPRMPELFALGSVFALPVRTRLAGLNPEGFGLVFAEAAASGLAVVAGDSGGAGETLVPGRTGLLIEPDDPRGLAAALSGLLADPDRAAAMGRAGREHVLARFSGERARAMVRSLLDLGEPETGSGTEPCNEDPDDPSRSAPPR